MCFALVTSGSSDCITLIVFIDALENNPLILSYLIQMAPSDDSIRALAASSTGAVAVGSDDGKVLSHCKAVLF